MNTEFNSTDVSENFRRISIKGRLDIAGSENIALKFASFSVATNKCVVVDLSAVSLLASIGIRSIVINAKALQSRGGKMVLFVGDNDLVAKTLRTSGIDSIIPVFVNANEADAAALA